MDNKTFSIIAFIVSFLAPIVGLVLGIIALVQINKSGGEGKGFAIAAIVIGALYILALIGFFMLGALTYMGTLTPTTMVP